MRDEYAELVRMGRKRYEVRSEPFGDAQAIRYVSAESGRELGVYRLGRIFSVDQGDKERLIRYAGIPGGEFDQLFPSRRGNGPERLWVAEIGAPTTVARLLEGKE
jgi:hypothetical protein